VKGSGLKAGLRLEDVVVPPYLPDMPEVRSDMLDYYLAVQRFDQTAGEALQTLAASGRDRDTLIVIAGDNGWRMPRGLANVYDSGTRVPLAIRPPAGQAFQPGAVVDAFVDFTDLAPTFLAAAGIKPPAEMTGRSLVELLAGKKTEGRDHVFLERERHANVRQGDRSYPCRAIRTREYLYVRNLRPELWPAGDPQLYFAVGPFGDVDASPTKELILARCDEPGMASYVQLSFAKRPAEELYDLRKDPWQIDNVAGNPQYAAAKQDLRSRLDRWMHATGDPRAVNPQDDRWDRFLYHGKKKQ
jgi:arylsulfatase A-like enzyme